MSSVKRAGGVCYPYRDYRESQALVTLRDPARAGSTTSQHQDRLAGDFIRRHPLRPLVVSPRAQSEIIPSENQTVVVERPNAQLH